MVQRVRYVYNKTDVPQLLRDHRLPGTRIVVPPYTGKVEEIITIPVAIYRQLRMRYKAWMADMKIGDPRLHQAMEPEPIDVFAEETPTERNKRLFKERCAEGKRLAAERRALEAEAGK